MAARNFRHGKDSKIQPSDDAQCSKRADQQFVQVTSRDIFDHRAAAFAELPFAIHKLRADQQVARSSVLLAQSRVDSRSEGAAYRSSFEAGHGQGQKLFVHFEELSQLPQRNAGIHGEREIARIVVSDCLQVSHVQGDVIALRSHPNIDLAARATRHHRELLRNRKSHQLYHFVCATRPYNSAWNYAIDRIAWRSIVDAQHPIRAQQRFQSRHQIRRSAHRFIAAIPGTSNKSCFSLKTLEGSSSDLSSGAREEIVDSGNALTLPL